MANSCVRNVLAAAVQFRIPKKPEAELAPVAPPPPHALGVGGASASAPQVATLAAGGTGPTLTSWQRDLGRSGECRVVRVWGLPPAMQHGEWAGVLRASLSGFGMRSAALSGWRLPSSAWRCSGVGYVLVRADRAQAAADRLCSCSLRCPGGDALLRPLVAELCDPKLLEPRDEPLYGHLQHGEPKGSSAAAARVRNDPIVPHFVQSNTLELDMSLQWRTLLNSHFIGRSRLHEEQAGELAKLLPITPRC
jgi:hypothetical protein